MKKLWLLATFALCSIAGRQLLCIIPPSISEKLVEYYTVTDQTELAKNQEISNKTIECARAQRGVVNAEHNLRNAGRISFFVERAKKGVQALLVRLKS